MSDLTKMEATIKGLRSDLDETRSDVKEMKQAMVGSVDGSKRGFAQQLITVMETVEQMASRLVAVETTMTRYQGAFSGLKLGVVMMWTAFGTLIGVLMAIFFRK